MEKYPLKFSKGGLIILMKFMTPVRARTDSSDAALVISGSPQDSEVRDLCRTRKSPPPAQCWNSKGDGTATRCQRALRCATV